VVKIGEDYVEVRLDERAEGDVANKSFWRFLLNTSKSQNQESPF